jgi:hypothetical protein
MQDVLRVLSPHLAWRLLPVVASTASLIFLVEFNVVFGHTIVLGRPWDSISMFYRNFFLGCSAFFYGYYFKSCLLFYYN